MRALLELLAPVLIGFMTTYLVKWLRSGIGVLDSAPAIVKQIVVVLVAAGLTWASGFLNVVLPTDLALFDAGAIQVLLAAISAMLIHVGKKADAEKVATSVAGPQTRTGKV